MKSTLVVLSLVAAVYGRHLNEYKRIDPSLDWRVVGGQPAAQGQFPFIVSLRGPTGGHSCGGSILNDRWVLSAAHCVYGSSPSDRSVVAGSARLASGGNQHAVQRIVFNGYNPATIENDIALLEIVSPFTYDQNVQPVVYARELNDQSVQCTLIGWGTTTFPGSVPDNVQYLTTLVTISLQECRNVWGASEVFPGNICTRGDSGRGACHGDSGGPLVDANGEQVGIVSWGAPCAVGYPDVYTRVSHYASFISQTIN